MNAKNKTAQPSDLENSPETAAEMPMPSNNIAVDSDRQPSKATHPEPPPAESR